MPRRFAVGERYRNFEELIPDVLCGRYIMAQYGTRWRPLHWLWIQNLALIELKRMLSRGRFARALDQQKGETPCDPLR